jgi:hypothetical protein
LTSDSRQNQFPEQIEHTASFNESIIEKIGPDFRNFRLIPTIFQLSQNISWAHISEIHLGFVSLGL